MQYLSYFLIYRPKIAKTTTAEDMSAKYHFKWFWKMQSKFAKTKYQFITSKQITYKFYIGTFVLICWTLSLQSAVAEYTKIVQFNFNEQEKHSKLL